MAREKWGTRIGFILAAVGSAVGLGNIWRFPFQVSQEGGAAFMVMYLAFIILIGFPAMLAEFVVGRKTELNAVGGIREWAGGAWTYLGGLFVIIGFVILSYYSVIGGWVIRYIFGSITGGYAAAESAGAYFTQVSTGMDTLFLHGIFMLIVIGIVALGVQRGIELGVKLMVPSIFIIFGILAVYAFSLPGMAEAYAFYLSPDVGYILENWRTLVPAAAGQGFFTLSLGMGVMITYASYLSSDDNLATDGLSIVVLNTAVSVLTGLIVFPLLFSAPNITRETIEQTAGPGAIFVSMASAFADLPLGQIIGLLFFLTVLIAALSSAISLIEVVVSYAIDEYGMDRARATFVIGFAIFILGIPVAFNQIFIGLYDTFAAQILLVLGGILLMIVITWLHADKAVEELQKGIGELGAIGSLWIWLVRVPVVLVLLISLYLGITGYIEFLKGPFAEYLTSLL